MVSSHRQKAPSAKRCIKTIQGSVPLHINNRQSESTEHQTVHYVILLNPLEAVLLLVRKHRAPKGALRREVFVAHMPTFLIQKAPSAKRCIKTLPVGCHRHGMECVRKHRAPNGALRPGSSRRRSLASVRSESTERQKVH